MEELLELLKDGQARTKEMLALELNTNVADVDRQLEFLESIGMIKRIDFSACEGNSCGTCGSCSGSEGSTCKGCLPKGGFKNMGTMWEVFYTGHCTGEEQ